MNPINKTHPGYTLTQLIIVVVIIGIIVGIAIPAITTVKEDTMLVRKRQIIALVETAKMQCYMDTKASIFTTSSITPYINAGNRADISIFYTKDQYSAEGNSPTQYTGELLKGFTGKWKIIPGALLNTTPTVNFYP